MCNCVGTRRIRVLKRKQFESPEAFLFKIHMNLYPECYYSGWGDYACKTYEVCNGFVDESGNVLRCPDCNVEFVD